jgi:hypothetical protein
MFDSAILCPLAGCEVVNAAEVITEGSVGPLLSAAINCPGVAKLLPTPFGVAAVQWTFAVDESKHSDSVLTAVLYFQVPFSS